jgi:hypothetical protein
LAKNDIYNEVAFIEPVVQVLVKLVDASLYGGIVLVVLYQDALFKCTRSIYPTFDSTTYDSVSKPC